MLLENVLTPYGLADHPYIGTRTLYPSGDGRFTTISTAPGYLITLSRQLLSTHNPCCKVLPCPSPTDTVTIPLGGGQSLITAAATPWYPAMGVGVTLYTHYPAFTFRYENTIDVPPYWAGALLAKGCSTNGDVTIPIPSRTHYEVMEGYNTQFYYVDRIPKAPLSTNHCTNTEPIKAPTMPGVYGFISYLIYEEGRPELSLDLEAIRILGTPWSRAHIPSNYQHAVYWERLAFLRGVMDYRGTVTDKGVAQLFVTSRTMLEDIHYLVRRVGGWTNIITCGCCDDPCGWLVDILLPNGESPFHVTPEDYKAPDRVLIPPWVVTGIEATAEPIVVGNVTPGNSYFIYPDVLVGEV